MQELITTDGNKVYINLLNISLHESGEENTCFIIASGQRILIADNYENLKAMVDAAMV